MTENNIYSEDSTRYGSAAGSIRCNAAEEDRRFYIKFKGVMRRFFSLDLLTLPLKSVFLLAGGARGSYLPFVNIFLKSVGLTTTQAGIINGICDLPPILSFMLLGGLTDHMGKRKTMLTILCLGTPFFLLSLSFLAREVCPTSNNQALRHNGSTLNSTLEEQGINATLEGVLSGGATEATQPCTNTLVYVLLPVLLLASLFVVPLHGYTDTILVNAVESINNAHSAESDMNSHSVEPDLHSHVVVSGLKANERAKLGVQKLFFSVGSSLATFLAGLWSEHFRYAGWSPYTAAFLINLPCCLLLIPVTCFVISKTDWEKKNGEGGIIRDNVELTPRGLEESTKFQKVRSMFRDPGFILFMFAVLICGVAQSVRLNYTVLLINDEITSSSTKTSLVVATSTISGVFGFLFASRIIRLCGPVVTITVSIVCYFIRFMVMSFTTSLWIMITIQLLNFQCFAVAIVAMNQYIQMKAPKEINTTMHSITYALYFAVGGFVANLPGGKLYDLVGGRLFFRGVATLCGVCGLLIIIILTLNRIVTNIRREQSSIQGEVYYRFGTVELED